MVRNKASWSADRSRNDESSEVMKTNAALQSKVAKEPFPRSCTHRQRQQRIWHPAGSFWWLSLKCVIWQEDTSMMWCGAFSTWGRNAALAGDGGGISGFDMSSNSSSDATRWRNHRLYVRVKHAKVCELHQRSSKYALLAKQDSDGAGEGGGKWMSDVVESVFLAQTWRWVNENAKPVQPWETFWWSA